MSVKRIDMNNIDWGGSGANSGGLWDSIKGWVNTTFAAPKTPASTNVYRGPGPHPVVQKNNQVAAAPAGYVDPHARYTPAHRSNNPAPATTRQELGYNLHSTADLPASHQDIWSAAFGSYGGGSVKSSSSSQSSSPGGGSYYGGGGSYGGGGGYSPPPPPMPAFHAQAPTFDRHSGYDWRPDDPGNVTPIDMGKRPAPYARDVAKYKKLLGEEV